MIITKYPRLKESLIIKKEANTFPGIFTTSEYIKNLFKQKHSENIELFSLDFFIGNDKINDYFNLVQNFLAITVQPINIETIHTVNFYGKNLFSKIYLHENDEITITIDYKDKKENFSFYLKDYLKINIYNFISKSLMKINNKNDYFEIFNISINAKTTENSRLEFNKIVDSVDLEKVVNKIHHSIYMSLNENDYFYIEKDLLYLKTLELFKKKDLLENWLFYKYFINTYNVDYLFLIHKQIDLKTNQKNIIFPVLSKYYNLLIRILFKNEQ